MTPQWPSIAGESGASAVLRQYPEDFQVSEELGFEPSGAGEHAFLFLEKRLLNTSDLIQRVSRLSGVAPQHIGFSGLKDKNALTRQWVSVGLAGAPDPQWQRLEEQGDIRVLRVERHAKKLKRGVHRRNHFKLTLRELSGSTAGLESALDRLRREGVPNYFGEQRFGREGSTLRQARLAMASRRKLSRGQRSLYYSAMRGYLFNELLAARVRGGTWNQVLTGDACMLQGTRSVFTCEEADELIHTRTASGDIHPALPLWGSGEMKVRADVWQEQQVVLTPESAMCDYLERAGLTLSWRATRLTPSDFCWQFCDDGTLQLGFALDAGGYATALLAELVHWGDVRAKNAQEQKDKTLSGTGGE